jgi:WD40 repeat protein
MICIWDTNTSTTDIQPYFKSTGGHTDVVEDVDWHKHNKDLFGSVGDDGKLLIWDLREKTTPSQTVEKCHTDHAHCIDFNPLNEFLLATGGSDNIIALWDLRNLNHKLHTFENHTKPVFQVSWSPFDETILASSSSDRRINIWDLSKIGNIYIYIYIYIYNYLNF